jgi:DNA polymerase III subunit beta
MSATNTTAPAETLTQCIVSSQVLYQALKPMIVLANGDMPIIENVCLRAKADGTLEIETTNRSHSMTATVMAEVRNPFVVLLPAKRLFRLLHYLPEQPITISYQEDIARATISAEDGEFELGGLDHPDGWPKVQVAESLDQCTLLARVTTPTLLNILQRVVPLASTDDLRPAMKGVYFEFLKGEGANVTTTDGHRLVTVHNTAFDSQVEHVAIVQQAAAKVLIDVLKCWERELSVSIYQDQKAPLTMLFVLGSGTFRTRIVDESYPNYQAAIPNDPPATLVGLNRFSLLQNMRIAKVFSNGMTRLARFEFSENGCNIIANDMDYELKATRKLPLEEFDGKPITIGFNLVLLSQIVQGINAEELKFSMWAPKKALIIKPTKNREYEQVKYLLMPQ